MTSIKVPQHKAHHEPHALQVAGRQAPYLPLEILHHILHDDELTTKDRFAFVRTNRTWYATGYHVVLEDLEMTIPMPPEDKKLEKLWEQYERRGISIKSLKITEIPPHPASSRVTNMFSLLPRIQLSISAILSIPTHLLKTITHLRLKTYLIPFTPYYHAVPHTWTYDLLPYFFHHCPMLRSLQIDLFSIETPLRSRRGIRWGYTTAYWDAFNINLDGLLLSGLITKAENQWTSEYSRMGDRTTTSMTPVLRNRRAYSRKQPMSSAPSSLFRGRYSDDYGAMADLLNMERFPEIRHLSVTFHEHIQFPLQPIFETLSTILDSFSPLYKLKTLQVTDLTKTASSGLLLLFPYTSLKRLTLNYKKPQGLYRTFGDLSVAFSNLEYLSMDWCGREPIVVAEALKSRVINASTSEVKLSESSQVEGWKVFRGSKWEMDTPHDVMEKELGWLKKLKKLRWLEIKESPAPTWGSYVYKTADPMEMGEHIQFGRGVENLLVRVARIGMMVGSSRSGEGMGGMLEGIRWERSGWAEYVMGFGRPVVGGRVGSIDVWARTGRWSPMSRARYGLDGYWKGWETLQEVMEAEPVVIGADWQHGGDPDWWNNSDEEELGEIHGVEGGSPIKEGTCEDPKTNDNQNGREFEYVFSI